MDARRDERLRAYEWLARISRRLPEDRHAWTLRRRCDRLARRMEPEERALLVTVDLVFDGDVRVRIAE